MNMQRQAAVKTAAAPVPRRDKSLSALSHELIARYGQDGTIIDLDDVQVRSEGVGASEPQSRPMVQRACAHDASLS